jgi:hypothetical protein
VGEGVTLTLRNITLIGFNTFPIVNVESDGRVIYETGVSIIEKTALPFSGFTTKTDSAIDKIRARGSDPMTLILSPGTEGVNLNNTSDLGAGLILDNTNSPAVVTIDGQGREVRLDAGSANGSVITVRAGVTLTLTNITLGGKNNNAPLIRVDGGTLVLEDGAHITGNTRNGGDPLANVNNSSVYDESAYGGGGGIVVHNGGSLEMRDNSEISGNYTSAVGGGVLVYGANSKVTMKGSSKISGNEASGAAGGGVYLSDGGALYMSGNAGITGNKTILAIDTGEQYGSGGGVLAINNSSIEMDGASKISYNHSKHRGAGVAIGSGSSLKMTGYSEISDNECDNWGGWGGGIYLFGNNDVTTATMNQNAGIKRNKASGGAGVSAMNDGATSTTFTMNGGFISNNIATSDSAGGVDVCEMVFNMTGGVISGNTTPGNGGGVSVGGGSARFNMTGGVIYGSGASGNDSDGNPLKNTAAGSGAAVFVESGGVSNVNTTDKTVMNGQVQPLGLTVYWGGGGLTWTAQRTAQQAAGSNKEIKRREKKEEKALRGASRAGPGTTGKKGTQGVAPGYPFTEFVVYLG